MHSNVVILQKGAEEIFLDLLVFKSVLSTCCMPNPTSHFTPPFVIFFRTYFIITFGCLLNPIKNKSRLCWQEKGHDFRQSGSISVE